MQSQGQDEDSSTGADFATGEGVVFVAKTCTVRAPPTRGDNMEPLPDKARDAIRARRIALGYSQPVAAKTAGVSITTWNGTERGRSNPQPLQRAAICGLLGWSDDSIDRLERGAAPVEVGPHTPAPAVTADTEVPDEFVRAIVGLTKRLESLEQLVQQLAAAELGRRAG